MKICITNLLDKSASDLDRANYQNSRGYAFILRELSKHLKELARRHRNNDNKAVDEFIDLYDLEPQPNPPAVSGERGQA